MSRERPSRGKHPQYTEGLQEGSRKERERVKREVLALIDRYEAGFREASWALRLLRQQVKEIGRGI